MQEFVMNTSPDTHELLSAVVEEMVAQFGVSRSEAVARVNEQWHEEDLSSVEDVILHEDEYFWALSIYFGGEVPDWSPGADRSTWRVKDKPAADSGFWTLVEG